MLKKIKDRELILSTTSENKVFTEPQFIQVESYQISFTYNELIPLHEYETVVSKEHFHKLFSFLPDIKKGLLTYKNQEGLKVFLKESDKYIIVLGIGEYQTGLYKIYCECVLKKNHT